MKFYFILLFSLIFTGLKAQEGTDLQLAQYYFSNEEFEKALPYCQKVYQKDNSKFNFNRYFECLVKTKNEKDAEKLVKKQISIHKQDFDYPMLLAEFYQGQGNEKAATKIYQDLIDENAKTSYTVVDLFSNFKKRGKTDLALQTLEVGRKSLKNDYPLHIQFAEIYLQLGQIDKMIGEYLNFLELQPNNLDMVQTSLSRNIDFSLEPNSNVDVLKEKLLEKVQKKPNDHIYAEMLIWLFVQKRQFNSAIMQAQALDKREANDGYRLIEIGNMCLQNKNYADARKAYKYVVSLGEDKQFYFQAEYALLNTRYTELTEQRNYSQDEINETIQEYQTVINRLGINKKSIDIIKEFAHIKAFYANQGTESIVLLKQAIEIPGLTSMQNAELKMLLADVLVLKDEIWDASLLYMQVDKDFKFEPIGFEAKYKNARIFYYDGDFKFAQSQLDVLKQSTTKLIANDAMKLSILITDNYGLDSNYVAMSKFALADLLLEQHQYNKAFELYDSIIKDFPYHGLSDEILLRKSQAMQQQGKWYEAIVYLEDLLKFHAQDILADDAVFQLGTIYETNLLNKEKAEEMYKKILFEYKGSLYTAEARKRYRALRGDKIDAEDEL
jgi:tetratricopeptide (TPR) repeat protein